MSENPTKADLFRVMGLGPVWELKDPKAQQLVLPNAQPHAKEELVIEYAAIDLNLLANTVAHCTACGLCKTRKQTVFADGVERAPLMVVGEAPGAEEDLQGLPFVGRAGQLLDRMLHAVAASRASNVYIANVLKCRPPANRNPEASEIAQCLPYLSDQIQANQPKALLLVGRFAISALLNTDKPVSQLRGRLHTVQVKGLEIPAVVTYHPAYLLRRPEEKAKVWDDLLLLKKQQLL